MNDKNSQPKPKKVKAKKTNKPQAAPACTACRAERGSHAVGLYCHHCRRKFQRRATRLALAKARPWRGK